MKLYNKNYKHLMWIPLILIIIFLFMIIVAPGLKKGIDLKGGNQVIVHYNTQKDYSNIVPTLKSKFGLDEVQVSETKSIDQYGLLIEFSLQKDIEQAKVQRSKISFTGDFNSNVTQVNSLLAPLINKGFIKSSELTDIKAAKNNEDLKTATNQILMTANDNFAQEARDIITTQLDLGNDAKIQVREVAPTLGHDFWKTSINVLIIALILLISIILLFFKEIVPSVLIIFAAVFDILAALAGMSLFNLSLSLTTIPALLMLIGYSVDTDIMLSTRVLKDRLNTPHEGANHSIITGLTMTGTTFTTIIIMLIISYLTQMIVMYEISLILISGLIGDTISTWLFNAPALLSYADKKKKKHSHH